MSRTGGGRGTNQYRIRGRSSALPPPSIRRDHMIGGLSGGSCRSSVNPSPPITKYYDHGEVLDEDTSYDTCNRIALHRDTSPGDLIRLSRRAEAEIRGHVARHHRCPTSVLRRLALDAHPRVRVWVAWNSRTPPDVLQELSQDVDVPVRRVVANNQNCPVSVLTILISDEKAEVRTTARRNPALPLHMRVVATLGRP